MKNNFTFRRGGFVSIIFLLLVLLDQWTKALAVTHLKAQDPFVIFPGIFQLRYLENRGAAFGMMQGQKGFFVFMAVTAVLVIAWMYFKLPWEKRFHPLRAVGLFLAAGALGNLIDRLMLGYVVDFFYFELIDFPIFNVADIYATCSTVVLAALILFYYKEEELEQMLPSPKRK